jgi:hypothetical protein
MGPREDRGKGKRAQSWLAFMSKIDKLQPSKRRVRLGRPPSILSRRANAFPQELAAPSKPLLSLNLTERSSLLACTENASEQTGATDSSGRTE